MQNTKNGRLQGSLYIIVTGEILSTSNSPNLMEGQAGILIPEEIALAWQAHVTYKHAHKS